MITPSPADTAARLGLHYNGIHWCDATRNVSYGCERVSPACVGCWAESVASTRLARIPGDVGDRYRAVTDGTGWNRTVVADHARIFTAFKGLPRTIRGVDGVPRRPRVWVGSMTDLFHEDVSFGFLDAVFFQMFLRPHIDFPVLTKRAERLAAYAADRTGRGLAWPTNVWAGATAEDQQRADERIPHLLAVPAAIRWLSVEPLLSALQLHPYIRLYKPVGPDVVWLGDHKYTLVGGVPAFAARGIHRVYLNPHGARSVDPGDGRMLGIKPDECEDMGMGIQFVVIGSESDGNRPGKRETRDEWVLDLVGQCDAAEVPVFVKQHAVDGRLCSLPMVDGRVRAEFPEVPHG